VGYTVQSKFLSFPHASPNSFAIRTSPKPARNSRRIRISKTLHFKPFRTAFTEKLGGWWASLQRPMARRNSSPPGRASVLFSSNTSLGI
jgi:hypothetical protein